MQLIERYVLEVETYLPKDLRDDVGKQLRSDLTTTVESRRAAEPNRSLEDLEISVLKELGAPHELADSHVPRPRVLFGPRLYPAFLRTIKIAIGLLVVLSLISIAMEFASTMSLFSLGRSLIAAAGNVLTGSLIILGIAVVVFATIERTAGAPPDKVEEWDPRTLPQAEDPDRIAFGDHIAAIVFLAFGLVVVNFFRERIGAHVTMNDESGWVPLLGPAFLAQLWLLNLAMTLDLVVNAAVLVHHRWSWISRWANFGVNCLYVVWLYFLVSGPPFLAVDPQWMELNGWSAETAAEYQIFIESNFADWAKIGLKLGFWAACIGLGFSLFKLVRRILVKT